MVKITRRLDAGAGRRRLLIALECDECGHPSFVQLEARPDNLFTRVIRLRGDAAECEGWLSDVEVAADVRRDRDLCPACRPEPQRPRRRRGWRR